MGVGKVTSFAKHPQKKKREARQKSYSREDQAFAQYFLGAYTVRETFDVTFDERPIIACEPESD